MAQAQNYKFKVLHTFHGQNGAFPMAQLTLDAAGNIYGTTGDGGTNVCKFGNSENGCGTVFKLDKNGKQLWLYSFHVAEGEQPAAALVLDEAGNLYGSTEFGGVNTKACTDNGSRFCGVAFKLDPTGAKETVLHKFTGGSDGASPFYGPLITNGAGKRVSTTCCGTGYDDGVAFQLSGRNETTLHTFTGPPSDGDGPNGGVVRDAAGNLYGTAGGGSQQNGTVFKIDSAGVESLIYNFAGGANGSGLVCVLLMDSAGNLYGTTVGGGYFQGVCGGGLGCGTVWKLSPQAEGGWRETTLYTFHGNDGMWPEAGPLVRDRAGNLYGTTYFGGTYQSCNGSCGVVFKIDPAGNETVLHNFTGGKDGGTPFAGLIMDKAGNLYGTAQTGGDHKCTLWNGAGGCGVVFEITPEAPWPGGPLNPDPGGSPDLELSSIWADPQFESTPRQPLLAFPPRRVPSPPFLRTPNGGLSSHRSCGSKPGSTMHLGGL
jgi:uncharacterized repeat protein (TIGR03803 family)